ncbi:hypothetical protein FNU76_03520 [Chitinimonas arctica]|uniref:Uncharacterized protein n=1 Tax=Chitinimonas arctica TaxID=2594795 RepID=A0A516SBQ2_9NEIS|nr:hypothetical protein [Chitinimonas arctica]QDQ25498.1 hypothetical protein FNU76_03520 [Chitinimonas arctica]
MHIDAQPYSKAQAIHFGSDIHSVEWQDGQLQVLVAREILASKQISGLLIQFECATGFRLLDELDLARYWSATNFPLGHHVLKINGGGWSAEENNLQGFDTGRTEWLIVTGNGCMSIFSQGDPKIENVEVDGYP